MGSFDVVGTAPCVEPLTRSIPRSLASIVAALELDGAQMVAMRDLDRLRARSAVRTETKTVAKRLRDLGWLLPTSRRGVWEFVPAAPPGPLGRHDPYRDVTAALAGAPGLDLAISLESALSAHGLLDRAPDRPVVAVRPTVTLPRGLAATVRIARFDWRVRPTLVDGTPTHRPTTVLVHLAAKPGDVSAWGDVLDALPNLLGRVDGRELQEELGDRPAAVKTRLAYLVEGVAPRLAAELAEPGHGKVWFGPRAPLKRHHQRFGIADTILPRAPASLARERHVR